jgi:hypothetical protein
MLTFLRGSGANPWRRKDDGGGGELEQGFQARCGARSGGSGFSGGASRGRRRLIKAGLTALACGQRGGGVPRSDTGGGGGVRGEDGLSMGMTSGSHKSASAGAGEGRLRRWAAARWKRQSGLASAAVGPAGCCGLLLGARLGWARRGKKG